MYAAKRRFAVRFYRGQRAHRSSASIHAFWSRLASPVIYGLAHNGNGDKHLYDENLEDIVDLQFQSAIAGPQTDWNRTSTSNAEAGGCLLSFSVGEWTMNDFYAAATSHICGLLF